MQKGNVAVAFILYALAVERLHSAYVVDGMADHRPDDEDNEIVNGVVRSLRETLASHPDAPVRTVAGTAAANLEQIAAACASRDLDGSVFHLGADMMANMSPGA